MREKNPVKFSRYKFWNGIDYFVCWPFILFFPIDNIRCEFQCRHFIFRMITNRKIDLFCLFVFFPPQILDSSNTFKTGRTPVAGSSFCRFKPNWKRAGFMRILDSVDAWWSYVTSVDLIIFIMEPESRYIVQVNSKLSIYIYVSIELLKIMWLRWAHDTFRQLIR